MVVSKCFDSLSVCIWPFVSDAGREAETEGEGEALEMKRRRAVSFSLQFSLPLQLAPWLIRMGDTEHCRGGRGGGEEEWSPRIVEAQLTASPFKIQLSG